MNDTEILQARIKAIRSVIAHHELKKSALDPNVMIEAWQIENLDNQIKVAQRNLRKVQKELRETQS